jgi:hypothetical protein
LWIDPILSDGQIYLLEILKQRCERTAPSPILESAPPGAVPLEMKRQLVDSVGVLLVTYVLQPVDGSAVELLLNGDMRHGSRWRRAVLLLLTGRQPDDVALPNLLDRPSLTLHEPTSEGGDERLAERVRVPGRARCGFKGHMAGANPRRLGGLKERIDPHRPAEPLR